MASEPGFIRALRILNDHRFEGLHPEEFYAQMWPGKTSARKNTNGGPSGEQCAANWLLGRVWRRYRGSVMRYCNQDADRRGSFWQKEGKSWRCIMPTDEQIIRRLAEMRGWALRPERPTQVSEYPYTEIRHSGEIVRWAYWGAHGQVFSPLTDRNTAHECMLAMPEDKRGKVCFELLMVVCPNGPDGMNVYGINWLMVTATPRQLCMAMYAAMEGQS